MLEVYSRAEQQCWYTDCTQEFFLNSMVLDIDGALHRELLILTGFSIAYALGRIQERQQSKQNKNLIDSYFDGQCELKKIQHAVRCARTPSEHEQLRNRLRCLFSENFELQEVHAANGAFFGNWLGSLRSLTWDDETVHRFRSDVQRLRAD